ncbi:hypothetical protein F4803DRAFT_392538 [Xylaria telfairii]|nr:hypothetical protein F4803DRAFT_392538 [Xylaria telfairii]
MSVRTQSSTATSIRKSRPAAPPRKDSVKAPRAPRKTKQATAKVEAGSSVATTPPIPKASDGNGPSSPKSQSTVANAGTSSTPLTTPKDLDQITNGMKKIKINVLTKEQKAARLKAKAETATAGDEPTHKEESPLNEQPPSPPTVVEAKSSPSSSNMGDIPGSTSPVRVVTPSQYVHSTPTGSKFEAIIPKTPTIISPTEPSPSSTPFASSPLVRSPPEPAQNIDLFVPYQPEGPPPNTIPIQRPVHILEPNTGTPVRPNPTQHRTLQSYSVPVSPVRRGGHGFTATSSIPFSPGPILNTQTILQDTVLALPRPATKTEDIDFITRDTSKVPEQQQ